MSETKEQIIKRLHASAARRVECFDAGMEFQKKQSQEEADRNKPPRAECICGEINARHCPVHQEPNDSSKLSGVPDVFHFDSNKGYVKLEAYSALQAKCDELQESWNDIAKRYQGAVHNADKFDKELTATKAKVEELQAALELAASGMAKVTVDGMREAFDEIVSLRNITETNNKLVHDFRDRVRKAIPSPCMDGIESFNHTQKIVHRALEWLDRELKAKAALEGKE